VALVASVAIGVAGGLLGLCGPFTDVAADAFCPFVLEIFYLGITTGTTATTYDPNSDVTRLQMAAFLSRSVDGALKRRSRRTLAQQFWTPKGSPILGVSTNVAFPYYLKSDGADLWVTSSAANTVYRVRASDGKLIEAWSAQGRGGVEIAMGKVLVPGFQSPSPGVLDVIDPTKPPGAATRVATNLGVGPVGIAFDGTRIWTANDDANGSVSIITPGPTIPWTVTTVTAGFSTPFGALYDGANIWIVDELFQLDRLDSSGAILQSVTIGIDSGFPVFDGNNIWVPSNGGGVTVVRASTGAILQVLTGNGLGGQAGGAAFDGERVLITNTGAKTISLFRAADFAPLGDFPTPAGAWGTCSDGMAFWVAINADGRLARF